MKAVSVKGDRAGLRLLCNLYGIRRRWLGLEPAWMLVPRLIRKADERSARERGRRP